MEKWLKEEIMFYLNNTESEEYCKLSDKEIDEIADNIWLKVADDNELNNVLNNTIEWYANHYIYEHLRKEGE